MPHRLRCRELRNIPKSPTPLKSVNFRHTTPGSAVVLVTKYAPQPTSALVDPTYPGAHLSLNQRRSLTPSWTSPHLTLHAYPKAFLSKPDVQYPEPFKLRPYPAPPRKPEQSSADMSMQVLMLNSRVVLRSTVRMKIKRRLKEAVKLIVTRGAAVEESRKGLKVVFRAEDVGADKWIAPDWTYVASPTSDLFRMSFAELVNSIRQALVFLQRCIPEAERILRSIERENGGATSLDGKANSVGRRSTEGSTWRAPSKGKVHPPRIF
ncbi:hypothetical protein F5888DRAFT_1703209 [Russula emetica]|nr:hypothetical protein F5888DRAFT_1703209 [Russula emetica]